MQSKLISLLFVQKMVKNIINAMIDSLKGIDKKIKDIDLRFKTGK